MAELGKIWAGRLYGTHVGNLSIIFDKDGPELEGTVRFNDEANGIVVYKVLGTYDDKVTLTGTNINAAEGEIVKLSVTGNLTPEGSLKGEWSTSIGSGGNFSAYAHDAKSSVNAAKTDLDIEQFYTQSHVLGALNLSGDDVLGLMDVVKRDYSTGKLIITYRNGGAEVTKHAQDFIVIMKTLDKLNYLKLYIQEPDDFSVNRMVMVELIDQGYNRVVVQGVREIWVEGKAQTIRAELMKREKTLITNFKKFGVSLYQIALFAAIVFMIDITPIWKRAVFGGMVLVLLKTVGWIHIKYIPNVSIRLAGNADTWLKRWWPSIFSWLSGITTAAGGAYLSYLLAK